MILPKFKIFTHEEIGQDYDVTEYIQYGWFGKIRSCRIMRYKPLKNGCGHVWVTVG